MDEVVVGVDGSPESDQALDWAVDYARMTGHRIRLVHVYLPRSAQYPFNLLEGGSTAGMAASDRTTGQALLAHRKQRLADLDDVDLITELVEGGAADALIERSEDAALLVVGARGMGAVVGLLMGSVSQRCAQHARCPVLVMRGRE
ncbi:universal stress protein [Egibacter rhizosphaerae]|uniref:Universal stress protein n=1 Tax=Egibacter rhizosphaerae TaxID=1670831 RepID=A0A411YJ93_9ACTN|nr:universal stress protein [Egibacter rhizosphaerae]QBI21300.1 universal stress protein [Egibacter rhizosphaerae]